MLLNSLSDLSIWSCLFDRIVLFSLLTCFSLRPQGGTIMKNLGLLSFQANAESFPVLTDLQVRSSGDASH